MGARQKDTVNSSCVQPVGLLMLTVRSARLAEMTRVLRRDLGDGLIMVRCSAEARRKKASSARREYFICFMAGKR